MKILFVIDGPFLPEEFSGQNRTVFELCEALSSIGHTPFVLAGSRFPGSKKPMHRDDTLGFSVYRARGLQNALNGLTLTLRPDVAIVMDGRPGVAVEKLVELKIPVVNWTFEMPVEDRDSFDTTRVARNIATTKYLAEYSRLFHGCEVGVVPPYINLDRYRARPGGNKILFVNPAKPKGVSRLFEIAGARPDYRFVILQSRSLGVEWKKFIFEEFRACGNIEWLTATQDVRPVLSESALLLLPRTYPEGFARIICESQSAGLPVLGLDFGAVPENIGPGGSVFPVGAAVNDWLRELDRLMKDETYRARLSEKAVYHSCRAEINPVSVLNLFLEILTNHVRSQLNRQYYGTG